MYFSPKKARQLRIRFFFGLSLLTVFLFASHCATHTEINTTESPEIKSAKEVEGYSDSRDIEKRMRNEYARWKGTRHRLGGTGRGGIDCSGFVRAVYKNVFNIELPRTTKAQVKQGRPIGRGELQAGDLVFFKPPTYPRHVGIFLNGNQFVHASKNKGVIISQIDGYYWGKYYWAARRILPKSESQKP